MSSYLTVLNESSDELIEKKSRFIGYACPVSTEAEAIEFVNRIRKKHPDARHNVYAYLVRQDNKQRYSDDGEPQGTAGMPVLEVLTKAGITDTAVVVTRYFGGILLGTGGLVRAYTAAAKAAVNAAQIVKMSSCINCTTFCDYSRYNTVSSVLSSHSAVICGSDFADEVEIKFYIPLEGLDKLKKDLTEKTAGKVDIIMGNECFMPIKQ